MNINSVQKFAISIVLFIWVSVLFLAALRITLPIYYSDFISGRVAWSASTKFQDLVVMPVILIGGFSLFVILMSLFKRLNVDRPEAAQKIAVQLIVWPLACVITTSLILYEGRSLAFPAVAWVGVLIFMQSILVLLSFLDKRSANPNANKISLSRLLRLNHDNPDVAKKITFQIVLWSLPCVATTSSLVLHQGFSPVLFAISLVGIPLLLFSAWLLAKYHTDFDIEKISTGLFIVLLLSLFPLCFAVIINTVFLELFEGELPTEIIVDSIVVFLSIELAVFCYITWFKYEIYTRYLTKLMLVGQLALPFLFLTLYPARLIEASGEHIAYDTTIYLKILILCFVIAGFADLIHRYYRYRNESFNFKVISPLAIIALIVALKFGNTVVPTISSDDYHFGENLLGWWTYLKGYTPYVDFMPAHGIINNDFSGFLNYIFYDGTAASIGESQRLAFALLSTTAFISIYACTNSILMAFVAIYFTGGRIVWLFIMLFAALWFHKDLIRNKVWWCTIWFATAPFLILGVPSQGLLLTAASSVIPLYFLWSTLKNNERRPIKSVVFAFTITSIIYIATPLGHMLLSAVKYVLVNGPINQVAYGISWSESLNQKNVLFEIVRMSWMVVPVAMLLAMYFLYQKRRFEPHTVLPPLVTLIFALLLIPYTMGRIGTESLSRPGLVGILLITGFLGIAIWRLLERDNRIWLIAGIVLFSSSLKYAPLSFSPLLNSASASINVGRLTSSHGTPLSNIGRARIHPEHWNRLNKLAELLDKKLEPKESYLDLTSRNAQYFYLDRKPITPDTAPYNMASREQQSTAIRLLENSMPRLALLEGQNIEHDGGGLALRSHMLYQFVVANYEPFEIDGFVIGLSKVALNRGDWADMLVPDNAQRMALFEQAFSSPNIFLDKLPLSWGRSFKTLASRMEVAIKDVSIKPTAIHDIEQVDADRYRVNGRDPYLEYDISKHKLSGQDAGLLKFEFTCEVNHKTQRIYLSWWGFGQAGTSETNTISFLTENGTLIVPLDSVPRWYLQDEVQAIRIELHNSGVCRSFSVQNLAFHKRK